MKTMLASAAAFVLAAALVSAAAAQAPAPTPPPAKACTLSTKEIAAGRALVLKSIASSGDERVALVHPGYIEHNPAFKKRATENKRSGFEEFKATFGSAAIAARAGGPGPAAAGPAAGPQPPAGNPFEVVTTECNITTVISKTYRADPTAPGQFYAAYSFNTFAVKDGKLYEHWNGEVINPPAPAASGAPPAPGAPQ